jgi:hypothetical protein
MNQETARVLALVNERLTQGKYIPLDRVDKEIARNYYTSQLAPTLSLEGNVYSRFFNQAKNHVATGYNRVVIGDYGAYIEFDKEQLNMSLIESRWPGEPIRPVKYIWLQTKDWAKTKVYEQRGTVSYADYLVGKYYISPFDVTSC